MRLLAAFVTVSLAACTSATPRPAPTPPRPTSAAPSPRPLPYASDLPPGAHHTVVVSGGFGYRYDDAGRFVERRWHGVVDRLADLSRRQDRYDLPETLQVRTGATWPKGDDPEYDVGQAVGILPGPLVVVTLLGRCAVDLPERGTQLVLDPVPAYDWLWCDAAAVDPAGRVVVLARETRGDGSRLVRLVVAPDGSAVLRRDVYASATVNMWDLSGSGSLAALPGGLVGCTPFGSRLWLVDLRGAGVRARALPRSLGSTCAAAGPDAVFVWDEVNGGPAVHRVTVSTGRVERNALRVPAPRVDAVLRVP